MLSDAFAVLEGGRRVRLVTLLLVPAALLLLSSLKPPHAESVDQPIYSFPFFQSYVITCPWGPYANCGVPGGGNHDGTDYSLGGNTIAGEYVVTSVRMTRHGLRDAHGCRIKVERERSYGRAPRAISITCSAHLVVTRDKWGGKHEYPFTIGFSEGPREVRNEQLIKLAIDLHKQKPERNITFEQLSKAYSDWERR